jgi:DNA-binding NtrC family response regulator
MTDKVSGSVPGKPTIKEMLEQVIGEVVGKGLFWPEVSREFEKMFIQQALRLSGGNMSRAAELMGVHRNTLSKKVREHKIDRTKYTGKK